MIQLGNRNERITTFICIGFSIGACLTVQCDAVNAVIKRGRIDAGYAGRQVNFRQISAPAESVAADCGHAVGKGDVCKLATGGKHIGGNNGRTIGKNNAGQRTTVCEAVLSKAAYIAGNRDFRQAAAEIESVIPE